MKNLFYILLSVVLFCSCNDCYENETKELVNSNPMTPVETIVFGVETPSGYMYRDNLNITKFNYEGHSYLWITKSAGQSSVGGPIHDPNCECFKTK